MHTGSVAAKAGLLPGCCVLKVGDKDVLKLSHEAAVQSIKDALASSAGEEDGAKVKLKLSFGHMEQVASYYYSTSAESQVKVFDQTVESAYCFELPAKVSSGWGYRQQLVGGGTPPSSLGIRLGQSYSPYRIDH